MNKKELKKLGVDINLKWFITYRECYADERYNKCTRFKMFGSHWLSNLFANEYYYIKKGVTNE